MTKTKGTKNNWRVIVYTRGSDPTLPCVWGRQTGSTYWGTEKQVRDFTLGFNQNPDQLRIARPVRIDGIVPVITEWSVFDE